MALYDLGVALEPVHTRFDGDAAVAAATGAVDTEVELVRMLAARAVEDAARATLGAAGQAVASGESGLGSTISASGEHSSSSD